MTSPFDGVRGVAAGAVMARMNADMEVAAIAMVEPRDGERFLVVGFGPGTGLLALLDTVSPASVLGLDPSAAMVRTARRRLVRRGRTEAVTLVAAPATAAPPDAAIDAAVAVNCQQFWDPHRTSVGAIAAALRPGGRLVTLTHRWAIAKRHLVAEWRALVEGDLRASGFADLEWSEDRFRSGPALGLRAHKAIAHDPSHPATCPGGGAA